MDGAAVGGGTDGIGDDLDEDLEEDDGGDGDGVSVNPRGTNHALHAAFRSALALHITFAVDAGNARILSVNSNC